MTKSANEIGNLITGEAYRDAIHVAVAPCTAGDRLSPGEHVSFKQDGTIGSHLTQLVGIVDPFLTQDVQPGQRCWVFLYPKTAQNLRHEWDHPAFRKAPTEQAENNECSKDYARGWLTHYAEKHRLTLNDLLAGVDKYVAGGCDDPVFEDDFKEFETPDDFWVHYKALTGKEGKGNVWGCCI